MTSCKPYITGRILHNRTDLLDCQGVKRWEPQMNGYCSLAINSHKENIRMTHSESTSTMKRILKVAIVVKKKLYLHGICPVHLGICSADTLPSDWVQVASLFAGSLNVEERTQCRHTCVHIPRLFCTDHFTRAKGLLSLSFPICNTKIITLVSERH